MSDLRIDGTIFEDLRKTFGNVSGRMGDARTALKHTDASVVGAPKLVEELHDFADEWGYGMKQLGKHAQGAVKMINTIGKTFDELDHELAEALKSKKSKKSQGKGN
ncbi:hypothetical protein HUT18_23465 [Streptomyces sp. NA04227]|uniref:hypothetical protein n=1 Tax=Streptomyces sp. NA04227 TaxID=2742136 RepID=UPI0015905364|nr:hypothetical protein [Streptomyces sp. NA04227]QKW08897.1 hypothetical protein HUT18_23465 [Streptomyces sp. NA04227]